MRIAVIAPTEIPSRRANTVQVMKMAQAFVENGHEARLASPVSGDKGSLTSENTPTGRYSWDELSLHYGLHQEFPIKWFAVRNTFRRYDYGFSAVRWARTWGADLVYTRLPQAAALSASLGIGTIFEIHDMPQGKAGKRLFRVFLHGSGSRRLVVITRALANDLVYSFGIPEPLPDSHPYQAPTPAQFHFTLIAPDGVDLARYSNLPDVQGARVTLSQTCNLHLHESRFVAGYTGHFYAGRGTTLLLDLAERLPEVDILLVGGEPKQSEQLREQVTNRNLSNVFLAGFVPNAELPLYQAACDVLLMPYQRQVAASSGGDISRYLSPMKLFEYMACGRAILSSDLPVLKEILNENNAVLLSPEDLEAWVRALRELRAKPALRHGLAERALQDVQQYTWKSRSEYILNGLEV